MKRRPRTTETQNGVDLRIARFKLSEWAAATDWERYVKWRAARDAWEAQHGELDDDGGTYPSFQYPDADHVPDEPFDPDSI